MNEAPVYPKGVTSHLIRYFIPSKQLDIKTRRRAMPIIPSKINMTILIFYLQ